MFRLNLCQNKLTNKVPDQSVFWLNESFVLTFGPLMVTFDLGCSKGFELPLH